MPLLVLLILAVLVGVLAAAAARALSSRRPRVVAAGREAGEALRDVPPLRRLLTRRLDPQAATGLVLTLALGTVLLGGILLAALTVLVRSHGGTIGIDSSFARWGDRHATPASTDGLQLVTDLGSTWFVVAAAVVVAAIDIKKTRSRWVVPFLAAVILGDKLLTTGLKELIDRARPDLNPVAETLGPSFPSGHSSTAAAFWAAAALVASRWVARRGRPALAGIAVGVAVGVAASRVLLDVHWLTDVLGGLTLGWVWFAACAVAFGGRLLRFGAPTEAAAAAAAGGDAVDEQRPMPAPGSAHEGRAQPRRPSQRIEQV